jgi:hypothetical protein
LGIVFEYPFWFILLCFLAGGAYAAGLYLRDRRSGFSTPTRRVLAAIRFVFITILSFLLLSPLLRTVNTTREPPVILVCQDNSLSVPLNKDSVFYREKYLADLQELKSALGKKYTVRSYAFGESFVSDKTIDFSDRLTDISAVFAEVTNRYANLNVGALVLASDGIYNRGTDPLYASEGIDFPVYTIALGDTRPRKDVLISKVNYNRIAYLGNEFPLEIIVRAELCKGMSGKVEVLKDGKMLYSTPLQYQTDDDFKTFRTLVKATEAGMQRYEVRVSPVGGEISYVNNRHDLYVEVLDRREKIVVLYNSPHPDVTAIRQTVGESMTYEMDAFSVEAFDKPVSAYDLVIFHQLPSSHPRSKSLVQEAVAAGLPILYIVGSQTNLAEFNRLQTGLQITRLQNSNTEALPALNQSYTLFSLSREAADLAGSFPPLINPFGDYKATTSANVLFFQKIGSVQTDKPLMVFSQTPNGKNGVIAGENIWKWRLFNYAREGNHRVFDEIINKTLQYMAVRVDKSFFRIYVSHHIDENQAVEFDAELYNDTYEPVNEPEVTLTVTGEDGNSYPFTFARTSEKYYLNAGVLSPGRYTFTGQVKYGGKVMQDKGEFTVSPVTIELTGSHADHGLLYSLARRHGGEMVYPGQLEELRRMIEARDDIRTVTYARKDFNEVVSLRWIFFLVLFLATAEWFIRKRAGEY